MFVLPSHVQSAIVSNGLCSLKRGVASLASRNLTRVSSAPALLDGRRKTFGGRTAAEVYFCWIFNRSYHVCCKSTQANSAVLIICISPEWWPTATTSSFTESDDTPRYGVTRTPAAGLVRRRCNYSARSPWTEEDNEICKQKAAAILAAVASLSILDGLIWQVHVCGEKKWQMVSSHLVPVAHDICWWRGYVPSEKTWLHQRSGGGSKMGPQVWCMCVFMCVWHLWLFIALSRIWECLSKCSCFLFISFFPPLPLLLSPDKCSTSHGLGEVLIWILHVFIQHAAFSPPPIYNYPSVQAESPLLERAGMHGLCQVEKRKKKQKICKKWRQG